MKISLDTLKFLAEEGDLVALNALTEAQIMGLFETNPVKVECHYDVHTDNFVLHCKPMPHIGHKSTLLGMSAVK